MPEADREDIRHWTDALLHRDEGEGDWQAQHDEVSAKLWGYFAEYVADRRKHPQDDLMTVLMNGEVVGEDGGPRRLSDTELLAFIGLAVGRRQRDRREVARLDGRAPGPQPRRARGSSSPSRGKIPNAVEELLRFEAPSPVQARMVVRPVMVHGEMLERGSRVLLLTGSAGRDEREYPEADRFDVDRVIDRHVSLGFGTHFCLGASLARLESRIAIEEVLRRFPEWDVVWDETEWVHTSTVRGYARVPVVV